jgi:hypothetical protein
MTIQEALNFAEVYSEFSTLKLPFSLAFKLHKINTELTSSTKFYNEKLRELIQEYSEKDENGNPVTTDTGVKLIPEKANECQEKIKELQELDIDWKAKDLYFTEEEMNALENMEVTLKQMAALFPFIW